MDVTQVALDYWLEPLFPESLPDVAARLLADGYDSPGLRESAGMPAEDVVRVREVFVEALRELRGLPRQPHRYIDDGRSATALLLLGSPPVIAADS